MIETNGRTIGVGFIGYGFMGRAHAHALHTINHLAARAGLVDQVRLVAIAGRRADRVERAATDLRFERWTTSWEEVVEDREVEVVANLTPHDLHVEPSIAALELGKPVLCEKPLAADAAGARRMLAAAESAGVTHSCAFNYRFVPALRMARELVRSGRLGRIRHYRALYLQDWARSPDAPRGWAFEKSSGSARGFSHIVDMLRHLVAEPLSVSAQVATFIPERPDPENPSARLPVESEDAYAAVLDLPDRALATLEASAAATGWKGRQFIEVNGSEGSLWWHMEDLNRLHVFFVDDEREGLGGFRDILVTQPEHPFLEHWWTPGHILGWEHTFTHQWLEFLAAVVERRPVSETQASFEDGYRAAVICDAIHAAAREGKRVAIEELEP